MTTSERESNDQTVLIIGGGIGGLSAAIALQDAGFDVDVYEQAEELQEVGAGLTISWNGLQALNLLGAHEQAVRAGATLEWFDTRAPDGSTLTQVHIPEVFPSSSDMPGMITLHRTDLQRILYERVGDGVVHLDHQCVEVEQDDGQVTAQFASGKEATGDLLVGADGIHSVVRSSLHGEAEPRFSGVGIWRAVTQIDHPVATDPRLSQTLGGKQRFGVVPIGDGRVYWLVSERVPQGTRRPMADSKERLARNFADWHEPIPALIEATPQEALIWDKAEDREILDEWGRGRITLLGDAAHLALPFAGQGACQALEDAVWLSRYLARQSESVAALRAYEAHRQDRTEMIVKIGRRMARILHLSNPIAVTARNLLWRFGPDMLMERAAKRMASTDL